MLRRRLRHLQDPQPPGARCPPAVSRNRARWSPMHHETLTNRAQVGTPGARTLLPEDGEPVYARRPGESPKAFAAFQAFRDLPAGTRSVAKAAEVLGKSVNTLHRWSR